MGPEAIAAYYDKLVDRYGHDPRAVDASSQESLNLRYKVLSEVCNLDGKSVLEVGCGFGDLGAYLLERFNCHYQGIDVSGRMIEEGRRVHPNLRLHQRDVFEQREGADVVLAQGIFYLLGEEPEAKARAILKRMFWLCRGAVAFTAISSWSESHKDGEFYMDPGWAAGISHAVANKKMVLRHDYHPGDLAMYLYR